MLLRQGLLLLSLSNAFCSSTCCFEYHAKCFQRWLTSVSNIVFVFERVNGGTQACFTTCLVIVCVFASAGKYTRPPTILGFLIDFFFFRVTTFIFHRLFLSLRRRKVFRAIQELVRTLSLSKRGTQYGRSDSCCEQRRSFSYS